MQFQRMNDFGQPIGWAAPVLNASTAASRASRCRGASAAFCQDKSPSRCCFGLLSSGQVKLRTIEG
jgi:hypothetical protein